MDDPELEGWLRSQRLPQQRVHPVPVSNAPPARSVHRMPTRRLVQVTLADCGAEGRGLVASGDIRQGEQILQVCVRSLGRPRCLAQLGHAGQQSGRCMQRPVEI